VAPQLAEGGCDHGEVAKRGERVDPGEAGVGLCGGIP
jgi:hypothetical protein